VNASFSFISNYKDVISGIMKGEITNSNEISIIFPTRLDINALKTLIKQKKELAVLICVIILIIDIHEIISTTLPQNLS